MRLFACPHCGEPLKLVERSLACPSGHSFDLAREGYVNLLPSHHRQSLEPGDNHLMVEARGRFLDAGYHRPLLEALANMLAEGPAEAFADLGCGEGYYTSHLAGQASDAYGVDISKSAIKAACRRKSGVSFAVASSVKLPFPAGVITAATLIMAPYSDDISRVLTSGGRLLRVTPGTEHLQEIKALIYPDVRPHQRAPLDLLGLKHHRSEPLTFTAELDRKARQDLIAMSPMLYRTNIAGRLRAEAPEQLQTTLSFCIDEFRLI